MKNRGKTREIWFPAAGAFGLTALVLCVIYACFSIFPFGNNTLAWGDMNQQVLPLMMDVKDILAGKSGLFLNLQNAGGMSFWGVFFFFLSSPFTFLVLFFEKGQLYFLVNVLVMLKLSLAAASASVFFRQEYPKLSHPLILFLGVSYGLCGYGLLYYQNLVWLDILFLFPVLMLGFVRVLRQGKSLLFTVALSLTIAVNYYLSYMVFLALLLSSALFLRFCVPQEKRGETAGKIGKSALLSLLVTAVVWLPSLLQCLNSARTSTGIAQSIQNGGFFTDIPTTLPMLLCTAGAVCAPALSCFFQVTPKRKALLLSLLLLTIPLFLEPVNKLWHTGSYQAFPARYGYIPLFFSLWCLADFAEEITSSKNESVRFQKKRCAAVLVIFTAYLALLGICLIVNKLEDMTSYNSTLWLDFPDFLYLSFFAVCAGATAFLAFYFRKKKKIGSGLCSAVLLAVCLMQGGFHSAVFIGPSVHVPEREWRILKREESLSDSGLYRVKLKRKFCDVNLLGALGYPSLDHYTSLTDERFLRLMKKLGYSSYWMETSSCCGTKISDILLSNKYILDDSLQWIETKSGNLGYWIPTGVLPGSLEESNRLELQNKVYRAITGGGEDAFRLYTPQEMNGVRIEEKNEKAALVLSKEMGTLRYEIPVEEEETLYFDAFDEISTRLREKINNTFRITVNGVSLTKQYPTQRCNGIYELGTFSHETVLVELEVNKSIELRSFGVYGLPSCKVKRLSKALSTIDLRFENGSIVGAAELTKGGYSLFLSIPQYVGTEIWVNGKKAEPKIVLDCLLELPMTPGKQEIRLTYLPQGFYPGLVLSLLGIALFPIFWALRKNGKIIRMECLWNRCAYLLLNLCFAILLLAAYLLPVAVWFL